MNGEIEKERNQTTGLLIINAIIWIPLLIIILLIIGVAKVNAYSYYNHFKDSSNNTLTSSTTTSLTYDGGVKTMYFRYEMNSNINANTTAYFEVGYTIAFRFPYLSNINYHFPHTIYYWTTNGDLIDITNTCSESGSSTWTPTYPSNYQSTLLQVSTEVTCVYTPSTTGRGYAIEYTLPYGSVFLNAITRSAYAQYKINFTQNPTEGEEIINNNNYNTNRVIESQNENTDRTIDAIENINQVCNDYNLDKNDIPVGLENQLLKSDGTIQALNGWNISEYMRFTQGQVILINNFSSSGAAASICFYDLNKTLQTCQAYTSNSLTFTPSYDGYIRLSIPTQTYRSLSIQFTYCYNAMSDWNSPSQYNFDEFNYYNTAHDSEMELIDEIQELSWNGFEFDTDTTALSQVWYWITRILLENLYIKAMVMTLLTLGVIKLVLNR